MAIKPSQLRKLSSKNAPILSHEFVIQNHADIVSCFAIVFVVGLLVQSTSHIASIFITLHHSISGADPSPENIRGEPFLYELGWKDQCAVFFYTLICIIMHAILQEYVLDKISKKLHLSKFKLGRFNESGQLVVFYLMSFLWGADIIAREGYYKQFSLLWQDYPAHPMSFLHKLYFIIQLAYYIHMLPELYFQKIKREDQQPKIIHSIVGFTMVAIAYYFGFQRIALVLLTLHYFSEFFTHCLQLVEIFDKEEKFGNLTFFNNIIFVITRFATMVIAVLSLHYGINSTGGLIALFAVYVMQGQLIVQFIKEFFRKRRERQAEQKSSKKQKQGKSDKTKKEKKKENGGVPPEADQNTKLKSK